MPRTTVRIIAVCAASTIAGTALAQEQSSPFWSKPVQAGLAENLYPGFASLIDQSGRVSVRCRIETDGHPYLCEVTDEAPHGLGFGAAARVIVASAEIRAARVTGQIKTQTIATTLRFSLPDDHGPFGHWDGPEPSAVRFALARQLVETMTDSLPPNYRDRMVDGLDFDRRQIVSEWIDELMPRDPEREKEVLTIQTARLFDENELQRILAGEPVDSPSEAEFHEACPDATPEELAAIEELKRRYCDRWECGVNPST